MTKPIKKHMKHCSVCNAEQFYGRKDHYLAAVRGDWKCHSCSVKNINFKGKIGPMPITWYEVKRRGGLGRGLAWDLTPEYIINLYTEQKGKCALTEWDIGWPEKGLTSTVSIDRIDSSEGYIVGNVQLLHKDVNMAKQQYSQDYFINMCVAIAESSKKMPPKSQKHTKGL
jgi:hypothetical protein